MAWTSPFSLPGAWYRGNLHAHTTQSDGLFSPEEVTAFYRSVGYDFMAITDHWVYTAGTRSADGSWITIAGSELHGEGYHMLTVGTSGLPDRALAADPAVLAAEVARLGGLAFYAHPYWTGQTYDKLVTTPAVLGIEVYNGVCDQEVGLGYSRNEWDEALCTGKQLYGLATDDGHGGGGHKALGWVMVRATELEEGAIIEALRKGNFYSSNGPAITDLRLTRQDGKPALVVRCSPCRSITLYAAMPMGRRINAPEGGLITSAVLGVFPEQRFVRVECEDATGHVAWSNPVFMEDLLD
ncbi:MAG: PHP domain-containing protein [Chloroflexi bacterium]|nr:PHP domain-containing protein [Chloroflexota bacterium]